MSLPARRYQSSSGSDPYGSPYQPILAQQTSTIPPYQPVQVQHTSTAPQRYASAPSSHQTIYQPGSAPPAIYGSNVYQPQYQPLPAQQNSTKPQRYASAPASHQPTYLVGSAPSATYNAFPYQQQYQATSAQEPSTVPSNYQYRPQSPHDSAPQPHASSTTYHPQASSYAALPEGLQYGVAAPASVVPILPSTIHQDPQRESDFPTSIPQQEPYLQATVPTEPHQLTSTADRLASLIVQDGEEPQSFSSAHLITSYLRLFPEAENDQGCRVFKYGPKCSSKLLLPLFEHFDFPRYALFPYGFANDFAAERTLNAGICRCQRCAEDRPCGHYVLQHHFRFYLFQNTSQGLISMPPRVATDPSSIVISSRSRYIDQEPSSANVSNTSLASIDSSWQTGICKFSASDPIVSRQPSSRTMPSYIRTTKVPLD